MAIIETERELSFDQEVDDLGVREETDATTSDFERMNDGTNSSIPALGATSLASLASEGVGATPSKDPPLKSTAGGRVVHLSSLGSFQLPADFFKGRRRNSAIIDALLPKDASVQADEDDESSTAEDSMATDFFDAEECGMSILSKTSLFSKNLATSVVHRIDRKGARCPLHGCSLIATGDQVYAPYLQRPEPLTDDMIIDRRNMLSAEAYASEMGEAPIRERLEIAYRLQKPKLLSDMNAFKGANPGAIFQDFVSWYGNPGNPLEDYCPRRVTNDSELSTHNGLVTTDSVAVKLDKATKAIHILNETRNFWSSTWDEATAIPASEQKPLFEVFSTVEMTLDYLENIHPAILLNQVMAVTFANVYFALVASAKDALNVEAVKSSIQRLRTKTEVALEVLAEEASNATNAFYSMQAGPGSDGCNFVTIDALHICEDVCAALSESEIIVALVTSLLQKFPGQYENVQNILKNADGDEVELADERGRTSVLDVIGRQQGADLPKPVLREYLLRNLDDANPCQLSVRYGEAGRPEDKGDGPSGLMLALTKTLGDV
jgi:Rab3 GTPase-activating protein catalytic subunit